MSQTELNRLQDRMFRSVVLALEHETADDVEKDLTLVDVLVDEKLDRTVRRARDT